MDKYSLSMDRSDCRNADGSKQVIVAAANAAFDKRAEQAQSATRCGMIVSVACEDRALDPTLTARDVYMIGSRAELIESIDTVMVHGTRMNDAIAGVIAVGTATFAAPRAAKIMFNAIDLVFRGAPLTFGAASVTFDLDGGASNCVYGDNNPATRTFTMTLLPEHLGKHIIILMTAADGSDAALPGVPRPVLCTPTALTFDTGFTVSGVPSGVTGIEAQLATSNSDALQRVRDIYGVL